MGDLRRALDREVSEKELQQVVVDMAKQLGWLVHHARSVNTGGRWRTPVQGDEGAPDLILVHPRRGWVVFAELKAERGHVSRSQRDWLNGLYAHAVEARSPEHFGVYLWRPRHMDAIEAVLRGGPRRREEQYGP